MRTSRMYQYQSYSIDGMRSFTPPEPSAFTSPLSPMTVIRLADGSLLAAYNPIPNYNGRAEQTGDMNFAADYSGRTPLVLRRSQDNGRTWGSLFAVETEKERDFCYPALYETPDGAILCSYMCIRDCFQTITMRIQKITGLW